MTSADEMAGTETTFLTLPSFRASFRLSSEVPERNLCMQICRCNPPISKWAPKKDKPVCTCQGTMHWWHFHPWSTSADVLAASSKRSEFGCAASETRVKATVGGIMQRQKHLKGHVVWRAEGKGHLPSALERRPAGSGVHKERERRWLLWPSTSPPVDQTFRGREPHSGLFFLKHFPHERNFTAHR